MNKETQQLLDYIDKSGFYLKKISQLRENNNNIKNFQLLLSYVIMEIVSEEKKFINMSRNKIELNEITAKYF